MALKRRIKKVSSKQLVKISGSKYLICKECKDEEVLVTNDIKAVTCGYCVQLMLAPPDGYKAEKYQNRPRGWHLKSFIELDGKAYVKGVEITDPTEIKKLRKVNKSKITTKKKSND